MVGTSPWFFDGYNSVIDEHTPPGVKVFAFDVDNEKENVGEEEKIRLDSGRTLDC